MGRNIHWWPCEDDEIVNEIQSYIIIMTDGLIYDHV